MTTRKDDQDYILVEGEGMEISVIRSSEGEEGKATGPTPPARKKRWRALAAALGGMMAALALVAGYLAYEYYWNVGVPISRTPKENIALLEEMMQAKTATGPQGVTATTDSIQGVAMDFYRLDHLRGSLQMSEPDSTDASVCLYMRSADYLADGTMMGATVVDGEELKSARTPRSAYVAMAGRGMVIGVSRSNKVKDYVQDHSGSFFRQFVLVSNGALPQRFHLHGKVERRALGRMGNALYMVRTRHKETMWDFADALREYGFVDAVYITGGDDRTFYRDHAGRTHAFGTDSTHRQDVPWLVLRK